MYRTHVLAIALLVIANVAARELPQPHPAAPHTHTPARLLPITDPGDGATCNADFLAEIRRHPHWTLRIDADEPRGCGLSPIVRDAYLLITPDGATWQRDRRDRFDNEPFTGDPMPQRLELTASERVRALAALDSVCAPQEPSGRWHIGVAIDPTDEPVMPVYSAALEDLLVELHERYVATRIPFAHGLSARLAFRRVDDHDRITRQRIDIAASGDMPDDERVDVLDCLASLPEGENPVLSGTLRVRGQQIWIAVPRAAAQRATCLRSTLRWTPDDRVVATPSQWPPPGDEYTANGYEGFGDVVGLPDGARPRIY